MINYKVNNHYYPVDYFQYKKMKFGLKFYISKDYFIKEYDFIKSPSNVRAFPKKIINFYENYYKSGQYKAAKLIDYEIGKLTGKMVYQRIGSQNLEDFIIHTKIDDSQGRKILKSILDTLLPYERNKITNGDTKLHNMIYDGKNVYMIDFDFFGNKNEDLVRFIGSVIYNFEHAYEAKKVISPRFLNPLPQNIKEYHSCCKDVAKAILDNEVHSMKDMIKLIAATEANTAEQDYTNFSF